LLTKLFKQARISPAAHHSQGAALSNSTCKNRNAHLKKETDLADPRPKPEVQETGQTSMIRSSTVHMHEVAHMGEVFRTQADVRFYAKKRGECKSTLRSVSVGEITLNQLHCAGPLLVEGTAKKGFTTLLIPGKTEQPVVFTGESVGQDQLMIYGESAEHTTAQEDRSGFHIFIPAGILETALATRLDTDGIDFSGQRKRITPGSKSTQRLRTLVSDVYRHLTAEAESEFSPVAVNNIHLSMIDEISQLLTVDKSLINDGEIDSPAAGRILRTALRYFEKAGRDPVYLIELCEATRVSERTLHYVFQRQFGISPMKFLKLRRLHLLRERLMTTTAEQVSVKKATLETGLWRLARYAQYYRELFGESPSETLRVNNR
jgi:AraC-like DNA-binding protein